VGVGILLSVPFYREGDVCKDLMSTYDRVKTSLVSVMGLVAICS
jgi:hypothetical protein